MTNQKLLMVLGELYNLLVKFLFRNLRNNTCTAGVYMYFNQEKAT